MKKKSKKIMNNDLKNGIVALSILVIGVSILGFISGLYSSPSKISPPLLVVEIKGGITQYEKVLIVYENQTYTYSEGTKGNIKIYKEGLMNKTLYLKLKNIIRTTNFKNINETYWCKKSCPYDLPVMNIKLFKDKEIKEVKIYYPDYLPKEIGDLLIIIDLQLQEIQGMTSS